MAFTVGVALAVKDIAVPPNTVPPTIWFLDSLEGAMETAIEDLDMSPVDAEAADKLYKSMEVLITKTY